MRSRWTASNFFRMAPAIPRASSSAILATPGTRSRSMARPVTWRFANNRGFLLVEATLTAVVIGVGLVFISRGLATNVKQLSTLQQYDRLLQLADTTLTELETQAQQAPPLTARAGEYESPN